VCSQRWALTTHPRCALPCPCQLCACLHPILVRSALQSVLHDLTKQQQPPSTKAKHSTCQGTVIMPLPHIGEVLVPACSKLFGLIANLKDPYFQLSLSVGPIANLKGHYFQPSLSVCCLSVSDRHFYASSLTNFHETWSHGPYCDLVWPRPQWSRLATEGPRNAFLKISKNYQKSQNSNFKILVHHFFRVCLLCIVKKIWTRFELN